MLYRTRTIRYVPDVAREEFVNLGIIVIGERPGDLAVELLETVGQIPAIGGPRDAALSAARRIRRELLEYRSDPGRLELDEASSAHGHLSLLARNAYNMIQFGDERVADGVSADALAEFLFGHLVARQTPIRRHHRLTRLRHEVLSTYRQRPEIIPHVAADPTLSAGGREGSVDLAVVVRKVFELNTAFTFQGDPTQQLRERVDAWSFRMQRLRDQGGTLTTKDDETIPVPGDTPIIAVIQAPKTAQQYELYREVTVPWPSLGITEVPQPELNKHARDLGEILPAA